MLREDKKSRDQRSYYNQQPIELREEQIIDNH